MITEDSIEELVQLFALRGVHLYHACQFADFMAYLRVGGIPSRALMEVLGFPFTRFTTDGKDKTNEVWDKVFLNLADFGRSFAFGGNAVPNPYGPILFRFRPCALREAEDVAVCLRSAGATGFDRQRESLKTVQEVDRIFYRPRDHERKAAYLKYKPLLQAEFGPRAQSVEISCTLPSGFLSFEHLYDVVVDPYIVEGIHLFAHVVKSVDKNINHTAITLRRSKIKADCYNELLRSARDKPPTPAEFAKETTDEYMTKWADRISQGSDLLRTNFGRFFRYLYNGTISILTETTPLISRATQPIRYAEDFPDGEYSYHLEPEQSQQHYQELQTDFDDDRTDWARSEEDGWFYSDDDDPENN